MNKDEKVLHQIIVQKKDITLTAQTNTDTTYKEAKDIAINEVLGGVEKLAYYEPVIILPITTEERWENHSINFCPRCGSNISDHELESSGSFDCFECESSIDVHIYHD